MSTNSDKILDSKPGTTSFCVINVCLSIAAVDFNPPEKESNSTSIASVPNKSASPDNVFLPVLPSLPPDSFLANPLNTLLGSSVTVFTLSITCFPISVLLKAPITLAPITDISSVCVFELTPLPPLPPLSSSSLFIVLPIVSNILSAILDLALPLIASNVCVFTYSGIAVFFTIYFNAFSILSNPNLLLSRIILDVIRCIN